MAVPAGYHRCITGVLEASGRKDLSEDDLTAIFTRVNGRINRHLRAGLNPTEAAYQAGRELGAEMKLAAAIERRSRLINIARKREIMNALRPGKEAVDLRKVLNRVDSNIYSAQADVLGPLVKEMRGAGLLKVIASGDRAFEQRVIDELWSIESGTPGTTGDKLAREAAEIINRAQERVRAMQNSAGAYIGKLDHYVTRQAHDMDKIRGTIKGADGKYDAEANYSKWRDDILPRLDERTFDNLDDQTPESVEKFMRSVWNALATGVHETSRGRELLAGFTGPANLARRVSEERKLIFKDSASWGEYQRSYGQGTLWETIQRGLDTGARNAAIMRGMGTNPEAMFEGVVATALKNAVERSDVKAADALGGKFNARILDTITGKANIPGNDTFSNIARTAMVVQTLSKLGGVVLSSLPDLANNAAVLRHNGVGIFESYANQITSLFPKNAAGREAMMTLGVGVDAMMGRVASRFSTAEGLRGKSAKIVDTFHRLNLLNFWTESLKHGMGSMLTHNLGRIAGKSFDALDPRLRATLARYDITAADWDVARATAAKGADGVERVLPAEMADSASRTKFQNYLIDQIREAMNEPDAVSRTVVTGGLAANTATGMAMRVLMQFKTYPITFINRTLGREGLNPFADNFLKGGANGMDAMGIAHLVVATSLLGYASLELKNLARGKNTQTSDADSQKAYAALVARAMVQGGGLGLLGDFLFGEPKNTGSGFFTGLLAGPTVGTFDELGKEIQNLLLWARSGDERALKDARSGAIGLIRNNAPFINMFYTRWAADYFIWYRLQEAANPGYLQRYEDRVRREQHQTFWLRPSDAAR